MKIADKNRKGKFAGECFHKKPCARDAVQPSVPGEPKCGKGTTLGQPKPGTVSDGDRRRERAVADDFQPSPIALKLVSLARASQTRYENAAAALPAPEEDKKALAAVENEKLWREALQQACGTCDFDVQVRILHHLLKANGHEAEGAWETKKGLVGMLHEIAPRDIQGAFAATQLIAAQENVVAFLERASDRSLPPDQAEICANIVAKLSRVSVNLSDFIDRHRGQGKQQENVGEAHPHGDSDRVVRYTETSQRTVEHREKPKGKRS